MVGGVINNGTNYGSQTGANISGGFFNVSAAAGGAVGVVVNNGVNTFWGRQTGANIYGGSFWIH